MHVTAADIRLAHVQLYRLVAKPQSIASLELDEVVSLVEQISTFGEPDLLYNVINATHNMPIDVMLGMTAATLKTPWNSECEGLISSLLQLVCRVRRSSQTAAYVDVNQSKLLVTARFVVDLVHLSKYGLQCRSQAWVRQFACCVHCGSVATYNH